MVCCCIGWIADDRAVTEVDRAESHSRISTMGRKRGGVWDHFHEHAKGDFKTARVACNYCEGTASATTKNMTKHLASCSKITRSIGRLAESLNDCSENAHH